MTFGEIETFLAGFYRRNRDMWEQTRILGYIIRFPWDSEDIEIKDTSVSDEDMKRLREMAKQIEKTL